MRTWQTFQEEKLPNLSQNWQQTILSSCKQFSKFNKKDMDEIKQNHNPGLSFSIVLTMMYRNTKHAEEVETEVRHNFGGAVHKAIIPGSVRAKEAPITGKSILTYKPRSVVAKAYRDLAEEIDYE